MILVILFPIHNNARSEKIIFVIDNSDSVDHFDWIRTKINNLGRKIWDESNDKFIFCIIPIDEPKPKVHQFMSYDDLRKSLKQILTFDKVVTHFSSAFDLALNQASSKDIIIVISDFMEDHDSDYSCQSFKKEDYKGLLRTFMLILDNQDKKVFPVYVGEKQKLLSKNPGDLRHRISTRINSPLTGKNYCLYNKRLCYTLAYYMAEMYGTQLDNRILMPDNAARIEPVLYDILLKAGHSFKFSPDSENIQVHVKFHFSAPTDFVNHMKQTKWNNGRRYFHVSRYLQSCTKKIIYFYKISNEDPPMHYSINIKHNPLATQAYRCQAVVKNRDNSIRSTLDLTADNINGLEKVFNNVLTQNIEDEIIANDYECPKKNLSVELTFDNNAGQKTPAPYFKLKVITDNNDIFYSAYETDEDGRTDIHYFMSNNLTIKVCNDDLSETEYKGKVISQEELIECEKKGYISIKLPTLSLQYHLPVALAPFSYKIFKSRSEYRTDPYYQSEYFEDRTISVRVPAGIYYVEIKSQNNNRSIAYLPFINEKENVRTSVLSDNDSYEREISIATSNDISSSLLDYKFIQDFFYEIYMKRGHLMSNNSSIIDSNEIAISRLFNYSQPEQIDNYSLDGDYLETFLIYQWKESKYPFHVLNMILIDSIKENNQNGSTIANNCLKVYNKIGLYHPTDTIGGTPNPKLDRKIIEFACLIWESILSNKIPSLNIQDSLDKLQRWCSVVQRENSTMLITIEDNYCHFCKKKFKWNLKAYLQQPEHDIVRKTLIQFGIFF